MVSNTTYGVAGEILTMTGSSGGTTFSETRSYNNRLQMTRLTTIIGGAAAVDMEYKFSTTQNNGKLTEQKDWTTGEEVVYTYDSLQRLATAVTKDNPSVAQWGQSYGYDGWGNHHSQTVIKGSAPVLNVVYDPATNRRISEASDANGSIQPAECASMFSYDIENRLTTCAAASYGYAPDNRRVLRKETNVDEVTFWSVTSQKIGTYGVSIIGTTMSLTQTTTNVWYDGKLMQKNGMYSGSDRLGSRGRYYPYGQDKGTPIANDQEKFATYTRDAVSTLDYADQRYYASQGARFLSPDLSGPGAAENPKSWNLYSYVEGDPVNFNDPTGLIKCGDVGVHDPNLNRLGTLREVFAGDGEWNALGRLIWNEQRRFTGNSTRLEHGYMAQAIVNRVGLLNGDYAVQGRSGRGYWGDKDVSGYSPSAPHVIDRRGRQIPFWYHSQILFNAGSGSFYSVLHEASYYRVGSIAFHSIGPSGQLATQGLANAVLDREIGDVSRRTGSNRHAFRDIGGGIMWLPDDCAAIFSAVEQAYIVYNGHMSYNRPHFFPLGWNQSSRSAAIGDGYHLGRTGSHNFWGYTDWWIVP